MRDAQVIIERVRRSSSTVQQLELAVELSHRTVQPGQLFLARVTESLDPYLREPWTPIRKKGTVVTIERPIGVSFQPGQIISLLGPFGRPIPLRETTRTLLLIAYDATPAALLMLAEQALENRISVTLALVGSARHYPLDALPPEIEIVRGDDKSKLPTEKDYLKWADQIVAVAPPPGDLVRYRHLHDAIRSVKTEVPPGYATVLVQPPMPCGVGACQACLVRCHKGERLACVDGPAFDLPDISLP